MANGDWSLVNGGCISSCCGATRVPQIEVWDHDTFSPDDFIGSTTIGTCVVNASGMGSAQNPIVVRL